MSDFFKEIQYVFALLFFILHSFFIKYFCFENPVLTAKHKKIEKSEYKDNLKLSFMLLMFYVFSPSLVFVTYTSA